ncbi:MAG: hypothetical protein D6732_10785 [Methanobacteriota archaeon]|nr:MAG: hypothetical protein D6732_10785 [Euryarchaeota archaeon]
MEWVTRNGDWLYIQYSSFGKRATVAFMMSFLGLGFLYGYFYAFRDLAIFPGGHLLELMFFYVLLAFLLAVMLSRPSRSVVVGAAVIFGILFYLLAFRYLRLVEKDGISTTFLRWVEVMSFIVLPLIILSVMVFSPLLYLVLLPQGDIARVDLASRRLVYPRPFGSVSYPIGSDWKVLICPFKSFKKRDRKVLYLGNAHERHYVMDARPEMISLIAGKLSESLELEIVE